MNRSLLGLCLEVAGGDSLCLVRSLIALPPTATTVIAVPLPPLLLPPFPVLLPQTELKILQEILPTTNQIMQLASLRDSVESQVLRYEDCLREMTCDDCHRTGEGCGGGDGSTAAGQMRDWVEAGKPAASMPLHLSIRQRF